MSMSVKTMTAAVLAAGLLAAATPGTAQTPAPAAAAAAAAAAEWRTVAPENLLVIDTSKGRIIVELDPRVSAASVDRIRTLADQGFYDGLKFHRVMDGFMAQTGDPLGTGEGGSPLPDIPGEFTFRRGRDGVFTQLATGPTGRLGLLGSMPVVTQPDAQMMVTADFKAGAQGLFCQGVVAMARNNDPNSANSQFFLMTAQNDGLVGLYTPFGRILSGLDVARSLKKGPDNDNGKVVDPDIMTHARTAAAMPEGQRPSARVMVTSSPAFAALVEQARAAATNHQLNVCDVQPPVEITGG